MAEKVRPARPDARPMRVVYGAGALAAVSVMTAGLVQLPPTGQIPQSLDGVAQDVLVQHLTRYIYLQPGQQAPPGATVIGGPNVVAPVARAQVQPQTPRVPRVRTHQSGRVR